ncbi:MAG: MATE family efflux transporter [Flavobacteriaceae bacterium]
MDIPARQEKPFEVTNRLVLAIAVPMTLAYLTTPLVGLVDTAVIGQLGSASLIGGVAIGSMLFSVLFTTFNFLRSGTTGLTAQAFGAGDREAELATLIRAGIIALIAGVAIALLNGPLLDLFLLLMRPSAEVAAQTGVYFSIRSVSAPFGLLNYALLGWFIGLGRSGTGLLLQAALGALNIALSIWFVTGLDAGIAGVAWATVIAEAVTAVAGTAIAVRTLSGRWRISGAALFDARALRRMLSVNRDIMIRSFLLIGTFAAFTAAGARTGDIILAANAILLNFFLFAGYFLDGFATAAEQLCGRALGARWRPAFDRAVRLTFLWGGALAGVACLFMLLGGNGLVALMTTSQAVREAAMTYLPWAALTPLTGVVAFQFDGIYIGATWSREMRNTMIVSTALFALVLWLAGPLLGNHGLWLALNLFLAMRGLGLFVLLPKKRVSSF